MPGELIVEQERVSSLPAPVVSNTQWAARRRDFNEWVNTQLRESVDFGKVPGTDKPTLLKPGAEKILQLYGCAVEVETVRRDQDMATGYLYVECVARAVSIQSGAVVGTGLGACTSYESKYRWRWEWWNGKGAPTGDAWETYQRRGGGTTWRRRIENRDLFDQWNTVLKMAKKRALVDLALTISGASEKFTQDVEDMPNSEPVAETTHQTGQAIEGRAPEQATENKPPAGNGGNGGQHWTRTGEAGAFMKRMAEKTGLTYATIQNAALNVGAITQYTGTLAEAEKAVDDFVFEQSKGKPEPEPLALQM